MNTLSPQQTIFARYGNVLKYPRPELGNALHDLRTLLASEHNASAQKVEPFIHLMEGTNLDALEEHYTRAFDLSPLAVPYLSVYLFGAENPQRGRFMAGLVGAYSEAGFEWGSELPDHLSVTLQYAAKAPEEEWNEFRRMCLPAPIKHMCLGLQEAGNPYQHLLLSLQCYLDHINVGEMTHV